MATPDWFTDCSTFVWKHICRIASFVVPVLAVVVVWYCGRIEDQNTSMKAILQQIQIDVAVLRGFRDRQDFPAPGGGVAMAEQQE